MQAGASVLQEGKWVMPWEEDNNGFGPKFVSESGAIMNRKALFVLKGQMNNPFIKIDNAFLGICMFSFGLEHRIFNIPEMIHWGLEKDDLEQESPNLCDFARALSIYKPKINYACVLENLSIYSEKCLESNDTYIETTSCLDRNWYKRQLAPPILSGANYQRCGPNFNNSRCSTNKSDWKIQEPKNGPCCSPMGYCIPTSWDCTCDDCVDFVELTKCTFQFYSFFNIF